MVDEIIYPDATKKYVKALRFANLLDDAHNAVSWTKVHVLAANIAGISSTTGLIFAWFTSHWGIVQHVLDVMPVVGGYLTHAHAMNLMDKGQRNKQAVDLAKVNKQ